MRGFAQRVVVDQALDPVSLVLRYRFVALMAWLLVEDCYRQEAIAKEL